MKKPILIFCSTSERQMQKDVDYQDFSKESDFIDRSKSKPVKENEEQEDSKREDATISLLHSYHPDKSKVKEEEEQVREIRLKTLEQGESDTEDRFDADEQTDDESHLR